MTCACGATLNEDAVARGATMCIVCVTRTLAGKVAEKRQPKNLDPLRAKFEDVIESLDRICPACMAATSQETWDLLHQGKTCPNMRTR